jgi:hypothetical protein
MGAVWCSHPFLDVCLLHYLERNQPKWICQLNDHFFFRTFSEF